LKWHEERVDGLRVRRGRLALAIPPEEIIINATPELITQLVLLKGSLECCFPAAGRGEEQQMAANSGGSVTVPVVHLFHYAHLQFTSTYFAIYYNEHHRNYYGRILGFLDRSRYFFFQVAPQLYSRG
jgi:hypothetical protein